MSVAGFQKGIKDTLILQEAMGIHDYSLFAQKIQQLVEIGKLQPIKNGKETNGKYPPLAKKYRIIDDSKDQFEEEELKNEIRRRFPLNFDKNYYTFHLQQYIKDRDLLLDLCDYNRRRDNPLNDCMSVNERMFDIFHHEKNRSINEVSTVLGHLNLDVGFLNIYETPEPFIYFSHSEVLDQSILIVENKDTWYTLRKLRLEGIGFFDSIIYGEGKKILKSINEIGNHQKPWFNNLSNQFYYFGDMDDEGTWIFEKLQSSAKEKGFTIKLWKEAYIKMYNLGEDNNKWRYYKDQKSLDEDILKKTYSFFQPDEVYNIMHKFKKNLYIPQEITNYRELKNLISEET